MSIKVKTRPGRALVCRGQQHGADHFGIIDVLMLTSWSRPIVRWGTRPNCWCATRSWSGGWPRRSAAPATITQAHPKERHIREMELGSWWKDRAAGHEARLELDSVLGIGLCGGSLGHAPLRWPVRPCCRSCCCQRPPCCPPRGAVATTARGAPAWASCRGLHKQREGHKRRHKMTTARQAHWCIPETCWSVPHVTHRR